MASDALRAQRNARWRLRREVGSTMASGLRNSGAAKRRFWMEKLKMVA